jgi:hypothetical protein
MSEYGFQSFPELKSVAELCRKMQIWSLRLMMMAHQKNGEAQSAH